MKDGKSKMFIIAFKYLKCSPPYLSSQFAFVHNDHMHVTIETTQPILIIPKFNTNSGRRTFHARAGYLWNSVPTSIRSELNDISLRQFKLHIPTMLNT